MLNKLLALFIIAPIATHFFNARKSMEKRNARTIEIYKELYPTTGMTEDEILAAAIRLTGQQG